jgi:hypothetical protein
MAQAIQDREERFVIRACFHSSDAFCRNVDSYFSILFFREVLSRIIV